MVNAIGRRVAPSTKNATEQVIRIFTQQDFAQSGQRYDFILDNVANHSSPDVRRVLTPEGALQPNGGGHSSGRWIGPMGSVVEALVLSLFARQQLRPFISLPRIENLSTLKELAGSGKSHRSSTERTR